MCTQVYLMEPVREVSSWDTLAGFLTCGGGGYTPNAYHALISIARTGTGAVSELESYDVVSIDTSKCTHDGVVQGAF